MDDPLATYLHDHLAGAAAAIDLLEALRDEYQGEPLGSFAAGLLADIVEDEAVLRRRVTESTGASRGALKQAAAWLGEKASRAKFQRQTAGEFGTFQALEVLALGILGKLALWQALAAIAPADPRLAGLDLDALADRARDQHARAERERLILAVRALN